MNPVFRGLAIYLFLLLIFRLAGKKTLSDATTFDFVLLLIISEVTQQAMVGDDFSLTSSFLLIMTLIGANFIMLLIKSSSKHIDLVTEGTPIIIVDRGKPLINRMKLAHVEREDILEAAREKYGLSNMEQIKYAVLEIDGNISIIPNDK